MSLGTPDSTGRGSQSVLLMGCGFMGSIHAQVYKMLPNARLVGVVDTRSVLARDNLGACGFPEVPVFEDYEAASSTIDFSVVDICLPTDLHAELATRAFAHGKHVFCEKPIALTMAEARRITGAAREADRQFMVGHCLRFWPEYVQLKRLVKSGDAGRLLSLSMNRRAGRPTYTADNWVDKPERCLGAALDLHIHDTDFTVDLLGAPAAVFSRGVRDETGWSSIATHFIYKDALVTAEGSWNGPSKWGFQMRFGAIFENGALDFDSSNAPVLRLTLDNAEPVDVPMTRPDIGHEAGVGNIASLAGYYDELAYFFDRLERGEPVAISNGQEATESLRVVLAEIASAEKGTIVQLDEKNFN